MRRCPFDQIRVGSAFFGIGRGNLQFRIADLCWTEFRKKPTRLRIMIFAATHALRIFSYAGRFSPFERGTQAPPWFAASRTDSTDGGSLLPYFSRRLCGCGDGSGRVFVCRDPCVPEPTARTSTGSLAHPSEYSDYLMSTQGQCRRYDAQPRMNRGFSVGLIRKW